MAFKKGVEKSFRFISSGFSSPYMNMALDEAIFQSFSPGVSRPTIRIYGWRPFGFSFGFPQNISDILNVEKCKKNNIPFVRRITGGGVIYHKNDISYSLICSKSDLDIEGGILDSYKVINSFLIRFYKNLGLDAKFSGYKDSESSDGLCCKAKEVYDVILRGYKIGGSAQRRRKEVILQHGSIPLQGEFDSINDFFISNSEGEDKCFISLNEALGRKIDYPEAKELLIRSFKESFDVSLEESSPTDNEKILASYLVENKYLTPIWNMEKKDNAKYFKAPFMAK
ncbi:MAG: lipoate--protein ligase family protein [Candidatus Saelkia tenebricola]|nr:lipoate--protein ligase family protein [Candidatus Saelkia tenebricola]